MNMFHKNNLRHSAHDRRGFPPVDLFSPDTATMVGSIWRVRDFLAVVGRSSDMLSEVASLGVFPSIDAMVCLYTTTSLSSS